MHWASFARRRPGRRFSCGLSQFIEGSVDPIVADGGNVQFNGFPAMQLVYLAGQACQSVGPSSCPPATEFPTIHACPGGMVESQVAWSGRTMDNNIGER